MSIYFYSNILYVLYGKINNWCNWIVKLKTFDVIFILSTNNVLKIVRNKNEKKHKILV